MASISEYILLLGVPMQINEHLDPALIFEYLSFERIDFGGDLELWILPLPVQIVAIYVASRIAYDDAIGVDHGHDCNEVVL